MKVDSENIMRVGDISVWVESSTSVHLKGMTAHGDPVELGAEELRELIDVLSRMLAEIE